jgi:two-component system, sporulation sensor kinase E
MMIVHRIMRDHNGEVGIDSKEGSGTIVTLKFPRKTPHLQLLESPLNIKE